MKKLLVMLFALVMTATACMTDESTIAATSVGGAGGSAPAELGNDDAPEDQAFVDDDSSADQEPALADVTQDMQEMEEPAAEEPFEPAADPAPVANGPGTGSLPADLCDNGQVIHGLVTIDDLVAAGMPYDAGATITYNGPDALDGRLACNVFVSSGGGFNVVIDELNAEAVQEIRAEAVEITEIGEITVLSRVNDFAENTRSDVHWPSGDGVVSLSLQWNSGADDQVRQSLHQISARIAEGASLEPTGARTPAWWVCDGASFASAGASVADIGSTMAGGIDPVFTSARSGSLIAYEECVVADEEADFFRADTEVVAELYAGDIKAANDNLQLIKVMTDVLSDEETTIGGFPARVVSINSFDTHHAVVLVEVDGDALLIDAYRAMPNGDYESGVAWVLNLAESIVAGR